MSGNTEKINEIKNGILTMKTSMSKVNSYNAIKSKLETVEVEKSTISREIRNAYTSENAEAKISSFGGVIDNYNREIWKKLDENIDTAGNIFNSYKNIVLSNLNGLALTDSDLLWYNQYKDTLNWSYNDSTKKMLRDGNWI